MPILTKEKLDFVKETEDKFYDAIESLSYDIQYEFYKLNEPYICFETFIERWSLTGIGFELAIRYDADNLSIDEVHRKTDELVKKIDIELLSSKYTCMFTYYEEFSTEGFTTYLEDKKDFIEYYEEEYDIKESILGKE